MNRTSSQARPPLLVVGGMHRSTTSLAASILAASGLHLGDDLMAAGVGNEAGHFEDNDFYMLHQRILAANGLSMEGFTCAERIDVPPAARDEAIALVSRRREAGRPWGWKDPRTVLFLDFWAELLPEARWLFVVRPPWEVVDSLFRRGDTAFRGNPRFAADVWVAYNRRILEFVQARPDRTAVLRAADVVTDATALVQAASVLLGTPLETPPSRFRPDLFVGGQPSHRIGLVRAAAPEAIELYRALVELAGGDRRELAAAAGPPRLSDVAAAGLIEWNKACQAVAERGGFSAELAEARQARDAVARELSAERELQVRVQAHAEDLTRDLVAERAARSDVSASAEQLARELAAERTARSDDLARTEAAAARLATEQAARAELAVRLDQVGRDLAAGDAVRAELAARAEAAAAGLAAERTARAELAARLEQQDRQRAAERSGFEKKIASQAGEFESRLAVADREWSNRLEAERTRRKSEGDKLAAALAEAREQAERLARQLEESLAEREAAVSQLAAVHRETVGRLEAEREALVASLRRDRDALASQLDAERGIYESLRQDLTGRIEAARTGRRKAG